MRRPARLLLVGLAFYCIFISLNLLWQSQLFQPPRKVQKISEINENIPGKSMVSIAKQGTTISTKQQEQLYLSNVKSNKDVTQMPTPNNIPSHSWTLANSNEVSTTPPGKPFLAEDSKQLKYILYWNEFYRSDVFRWGSGQQPFIDNGCEVNTCFGTNDRELLPIESYDAILFHVQTLGFFDWPRKRSPHQRYVFVTLESAQYKTIPLQFYRKMFNLTLTYRRDSDFPYPYGKFERITGTPSTSTPQSEAPSAAMRNYAAGKDRLVAWFVSHCDSRSRREKYVRYLQSYIQVDVYGDCGTLKCARTNNNSCHATLLDNHYKFYLSFENSLCNDYVTEKLFDALQHDVVPVVFGAADYDQFAPPNSYIDATKFSPKELAEYLLKLDANDALYNSYFQWKGKYRLIEAEVYRRSSFCDLCKYVHGNQTKVYDDINKWWTRYQCKVWKLKPL